MIRSVIQGVGSYLPEKILTNADLAGESSYHPLLDEVVQRLDRVGLLQESEGADVVFPPGFTNREGEPLPLIVRKGNGGFNYATSDLACVIDRVERIGATLMLYVVGAPQAQHFEMVWKVCEMAGWLRPPARCVHVQFGSVLGADRKMFKTRSGDTVKLGELLEEAEERALKIVSEKSPELPEVQRREIARVVGLGAVKYADLLPNRQSDYQFNWEKMLALQGNTAPYLQYAYTRVRSIFRKSGANAETGARNAETALAAADELALAKHLMNFGLVLETVADECRPNFLCNYLYELAGLFARFYESCPVLKAEGTERATRLLLCDLTGRVLRQGLATLGIEVTEQM